jgi:hypothetical protein
MALGKQAVEKDARERATYTLADGKPIMEKGLLIRCANQIELLKAALNEIATQAPKQGGIWARQRAEQALEHEE